MSRRPVAFLLVALSLILAPLGLCLDHSTAMAQVPGEAAMAGHGDHESHATADSHAQEEGERHFCAECRPDSFVKASADKSQILAPAAPLAANLAPKLAITESPKAETQSARAQAQPPPPPLRRYRVRLRI